MKKVTVVLMVLFVLAPLMVSAASVEELERRLARLESDQAELYHSLAEKKKAGLGTLATEHISLSGLLELEAGYQNLTLADGTHEGGSDVVLATAQLGLGIEVNEQVSGDLILLYEEDATDLEVDEAAINYANGPWSGRFGQQYLPFGAFYSHFISDPLLLDLGETRETALLAGYEQGPLALSAFIFNGDAEKSTDSEDHLDDWGLSLTLKPAEGLELGASYLADLADTDAELAETYSRRVGGWSAYAVAGFGSYELSGEMLGAARRFAAGDVDADGDGRGDRPFAWNVELGWHPAEPLELALRLEGSDEIGGAPQRQYGLCASWGPWESVSLSLEYLRGEFGSAFGADEEGRALDSRDLITTQLAVEF